MISKLAGQRIGLVLVGVGFLLPVILAKLALDNDWFNKGVTNRGTLVEGELRLEHFHPQALPQGWKLLAWIPGECDKECEALMYGLKQVKTALGRETERTQVVALGQTQASGVEFEIKAVDKPLPYHSNTALIVDPLGNLVLQYQGFKTQDEAVALSRDILADLKKLLKYSRIG